MSNNFIALTTYNFASSRELEECSWWSLVNKNQFVLVNNRVSDDVVRNSIAVTNHTPTILENDIVDISINRYTKTDVFDIFKYYNINHPKAVVVGALTGSTLVYRLANMNLENDLEINIDDIVSIRSNSSSRGIGNITIKVNKLIELSYLVQTFKRKLTGKKEQDFDIYKQLRVEIDKISEPRRGYGDYRTEEEKYRIEEMFLNRSNQLLIQEYINTPYEEYRLYLTYDMDSVDVNTLIGIKRKGYSLTASREEMIDEVITGEDMVNLFEDTGFKDIINKLLLMIREQKHLVISVDLYKIKTDNTWGVFEFSTEYSIEGVSVYHVLRLKNHINSSLEKIYTNKINRDKKETK